MLYNFRKVQVANRNFLETFKKRDFIELLFSNENNRNRKCNKHFEILFRMSLGMGVLQPELLQSDETELEFFPEKGH